LLRPFLLLGPSFYCLGWEKSLVLLFFFWLLPSSGLLHSWTFTRLHLSSRIVDAINCTNSPQVFSPQVSGLPSSVGRIAFSQCPLAAFCLKPLSARSWKKRLRSGFPFSTTASIRSGAVNLFPLLSRQSFLGTSLLYSSLELFSLLATTLGCPPPPL